MTGTDLSDVRFLFDQNGTSSSDGVNYNLSAAADWDSNAGAAFSTQGVTVSGITPTINSSSYDASTGHLTVTGIGFTTSAGDYSASALTLAGEGGNTYTLTGGSTIENSPTSTSFVVDLSAADQLALDGLLNQNGTSSVGATTYNLAATSSFDTGGNAAGTTAITVSNALAPTISAVAFNDVTGVLTLTGTGFENEGGIGGLRLGDFTLTGQGGVSYTLTSANAAVASQTSATITLTDADLTGVKALFDKNGTASADGTTYNLAAGAHWDANVGATIGTEGVTVSGITPTISSAIYDASTGHLTISGIGFTTSAGDYNASALTLTGEGGNTYTLTGGSTIAANPTSTSFVVDLSAADQLAVDGLLNQSATSSIGGTTYNLAAASSFDTGGNAAGTTAITVSNALAPTISTVAFNDVTGVLTLTGTGFENEGGIGGLRLGDFTLTGQGGGSWTLASANAAVASQTSATITLTGADLAGVKALFDKNGTASLDGTTYNLFAGAHWDANAGATVGTEGVTVSGVAAITNDFSGDGKSGVLFQGATGEVWMWLMNGNQIASTQGVGNPGTDWHVVGTGDFNGDGKSDLLFQDAEGQIWQWLMNGSQIMTSQNVGNPGADWHVVGTGDFNGDGKADILMQDRNGDVSQWLMNGNQITSSNVIGFPESDWHVVGTGDFNGDGKSDVLLQSDAGGVWEWQMNGSTITSTTSIGNPGADWHVVGTGDFYGDGKTDILLQNDQGQVWQWQMNGATITSSTSVGNPGADWHVASTGDFNGDGKSDILFQNAQGQVWQWLMNGSQITSTSTIGTPGSSWPVT